MIYKIAWAVLLVGNLIYWATNEDYKESWFNMLFFVMAVIIVFCQVSGILI